MDFEVLKLLTENDLADMKLPVGPKRKIAHALAAFQGVLCCIVVCFVGG